MIIERNYHLSLLIINSAFNACSKSIRIQGFESYLIGNPCYHIPSLGEKLKINLSYFGFLCISRFFVLFAQHIKVFLEKNLFTKIPHPIGIAHQGILSFL